MSTYSMRSPGWRDPVEFSDVDLRVSGEFADPEIEDIAALGVGETAVLSDGSRVTRIN